MNSEGKTMDCLRQYLSRLPWGSKHCTEARQALMDFTGVTNPDTVRRWQVGDCAPLGLILVKLRYFLETQGYRVAELAKLDKSVRDLGKLVAFGKVDCAAAAKQLGFTEVNGLFQALHGKRQLSPERTKLAEGICGQWQAYLAGLPTPKASPETAAAVQPATTDDNEEIIQLLRVTDGLVSLLAPRLKRLVSDGIPPEARYTFREKAGRELVFELANRLFGTSKLLNALCSEKAREIVAAQKQI